MNLISAGDWLDIRTALADVKDTFLMAPVLYVQRRTRKLSKFHEHRSDDLAEDTFELLCLKVELKVDDKAKVMQSKNGFADFSEGYLLFDYQVLLAHDPALIDGNGLPVFVPNVDTFVMHGQELTVIGVNLVGPTETDYQLVKVHFKKNLVNNNPLPEA